MVGDVSMDLNLRAYASRSVKSVFIVCFFFRHPICLSMRNESEIGNVAQRVSGSERGVSSGKEETGLEGVRGVTIEKQPYPMGQGRAKLHFCPVNKTLQLITSAKSIPCEIEGNNRK
ncbi:hypothetical protein QTP88_013568 [Uroleucon formosanum]